jgi:histidinol-phosphatase
VTTRWFARTDLAVDNKADGTPVTEADRAAERHVRERLAEACPDDGIVGEEEAPVEGTSGRRWIVDPIDGTKAFTRGVPLYSTLLAYEDEHGPAVGVIVIPALQQAVWAGRGLGCWYADADGEPRPAKVSDTPTLAASYIMTSCFGTVWDTEALIGVKDTGASLRTWGDGYGYLLVATGRADAMVNPEAELYDVAPMPIILREAGGEFTSLSGEWDADCGNGVASNGIVHEELLKLLNGG